MGPQGVFVALAVPTALAVFIALSLPKVDVTAKRSAAPQLVRPAPIDVLFFLQGYGVDGVFALSITLIFARDMPLADAVAAGGILLAGRHFGEAIAAPLFGSIADRFGARRVFVIAAILTTVSFAMVAAGLVIAGAIIMVLFRGALASLGPAVIVEGLDPDADTIGPLARMQAWRDFGAACGPLVTGFLLTVIVAEVQLAAVAVALTAGLAYWRLTPAR